MKKVNTSLIFATSILFQIINVSVFAEYSITVWDMSKSPITKTVSVPTSQNFPQNKVEVSRQVLGNNQGDIVFGRWHQDSTELHNPLVEDEKLVFSGGQTAYVENVMGEVHNFRKLEFDFTPYDISKDVNIFDIPYSIQVRLEPHPNNNTARLRFYVTNDNGTMRNVKTDYTITAHNSYNVECSIEEGFIIISLDGTILEGQWDKGMDTLNGLVRQPVYPHLFIGSRWDGEVRWFNGDIDNVRLTFYCGNNCPDWGYFRTDLNRDGYTNKLDFVKFADTWQDCTEPNETDCSPAWKILTGDDGLEMRRNRLLAAALGLRGSFEDRDSIVPNTYPMRNIFGAYSSTVLRLGLYPEQTNEVIRYICENMEKPRGRLDYAVNEENFTGLELARIYVTLNDSELLEESTRQAIREVFKNYDLEPGLGTRSENHYLIFRAIRYLMAQEMLDETFDVYGKTGAQLYEEDGLWLKEFMRFRARRGWGEFDSSAYQFLSMNVILTLYDLAKDDEITKLAGMKANLMLADMAVDTINGLYSGARGRVGQAEVLDSSKSAGNPPMNNMNEIQYLYFDIADPNPETGLQRLINLEGMNFWERSNQSLFSSFKPMQIVKDIMLDRPHQYINKERKHLHNMADPMPENPLEGSIRKYTLYVPGKYSLGSIQLQDDYPEDLPEGIYAKHQQLEWIFVVASGTRARIFTHHPGNTAQHGYWVGDLGCNCINTFQNKTAVLSIFDISPDKPFQYIHAYFPKTAFDEIVEESGWIFARKGDVYAALNMVDDYEWTTEGQWRDVEVKSYGSKKASVFEAGIKEDFGSFEAFRNEIKQNSIIFNTSTMTLAYNSQKAGLIKMNTDGLRQVNNNDVDLDYQTYDSPYMQSQWDSGIITLKHNGNEVVLDFN